jgi:hypothetical protein
VPDEESNTTGRSGADHKQNARELIDEATGSDDLHSVLMTEFCLHLEGLLQLPKDSIRGDNSIAELGVDSLVAVEIRSWFWKTVAKDIAVLRILGSSSITKCKFSRFPPQTS